MYAASRFSRRQWRRRLRQLRALFVAVAVLGTAAFAGWVVLGSSWLAAEQVSVKGEHALSERQILAAADVDVGTPMLRLDLDAVVQRVAALLPVAHVSVHRAWPHTITITITERQPVATIYRANSWWMVDKEGVVFRRSPGRVAGLPVVSVGNSVDPAALHEAVSVIAALPTNLLARVQRLTAPSMDSITLALKDGREVRWGSAAESDQKVQVLSVLLNQPARVYDVSVPAQPTTVD